MPHFQVADGVGYGYVDGVGVTLCVFAFLGAIERKAMTDGGRRRSGHNDPFQIGAWEGRKITRRLVVTATTKLYQYNGIMRSLSR